MDVDITVRIVHKYAYKLMTQYLNNTQNGLSAKTVDTHSTKLSCRMFRTHEHTWYTWQLCRQMQQCCAWRMTTQCKPILVVMANDARPPTWHHCLLASIKLYHLTGECVCVNLSRVKLATCYYHTWNSWSTLSMPSHGHYINISMWLCLLNVSRPNPNATM